MISKKKTKRNPISQTYFYSGTGNTFLIQYNDSKAESAKAPSAKEVVKSCRKYKADGFVVINKNNQKFYWDFLNNDGSFAAFCGNAARCVSDLLFKKTGKSKVQFTADRLRVVGTKKPGKQVSVRFTKKIKKKSVLLRLDAKTRVPGIFLDSGVPHFVLMAEKNKILAKKIRGHHFFGKGGTNVTFVDKYSESKMDAITFERGVEDFTLACGTGAIAAAAALGTKKTLIKMPGGVLKVEINKNEITLTGKVSLLKKINI